MQVFSFIDQYAISLVFIQWSIEYNIFEWSELDKTINYIFWMSVDQLNSLTQHCMNKNHYVHKDVTKHHVQVWLKSRSGLSSSSIDQC